ncbi:DUF4190 domain-containing protein [Leifsonia sp. C5G2]|uniref:DUF4190 domain-containing protein n=1 Tax=Leifsonia sp. C5G2 TaxID=2735269 RepID=UPI0015858FE2|nr:DUF4190 domain-containing protein [Leifsonia sp. C5G2]NUU04829.1 DUF4190 domain-containing protein [Leifsonia sp. C5G2]
MAPTSSTTDIRSPQTAPPAGTNPLAIVTLVAAFLFPLAAIICGHISLGQIRRSGQNGRGLAKTGLVLGYVFLAVWVLLLVLIVIGVMAAASDPTSGLSGY